MRVGVRFAEFAAAALRCACLAVALWLAADPGAALAQPGRHYFVEFRARADDYLGHNFIVYGRLDRAGWIVERRYISLVPEEDGRKGVIFPIRGSVRTSITDVRAKPTATYQRRLSPAQFAKLLATIRELRATEHLWHAFFFNCNDFANRIAEAVDLHRPPSLVPPAMWVAMLRAMNEH